MIFPPDAAQVSAGIGAEFWGMDYSNVWAAIAFSDGSVTLNKLVNKLWTTIWSAAANNTLVKSGPTDVNSVRAVVKNGTITVIVNGQTVKSVRAQMPGGDLKFGFLGQYTKSSPTPVLFPVRSYKVTTGE
jgi:hypothetical protein